MMASPVHAAPITTAMVQQDEHTGVAEGVNGTIENFDFDEFVEFVEFGDSMTAGGDGYPKFDWNLQNTPPYDEYPFSVNPARESNTEGYAPQQENPRPTYLTPINTLSFAQQEQLRSIAMPRNLHYRDQYSPKSASSTHTHKSSLAMFPDHQGNNLKRKSSAEADDEDEEEDDDNNKDGQGPPVKKTAHNMIEKRYRTNLNDKIAALRDSVPSLRAMRKPGKGGNNAEIKEDLQGLTPAHKLNKATVLSKATEYIRHLEKRNARLSDENIAMRGRIFAFERLFLSGSMGLNSSAQKTHNFYAQEQYMTAPPNGGEVTPGNPPQGMIEVPDDIKRLHAAANQLGQQTYPVPQEHYRPINRVQAGQNVWQNRGGYIGKMMIGSLAGLMILEGFSEAEQDRETPNGRGLFALPTRLLSGLARVLKNSTDISLLGYHSPASQTIAVIRMILVLGTMLFIFVPSFFGAKLWQRNQKTQNKSPNKAPFLASPIQVRRQAWLTAVQTVWVPRHSFFLEAAALCLKMIKLSLRNAIGWYGYSLLTGATEQHEEARTKAWSIALDAQLAGGDVEINKSRLILTLMASGTLPDTPARLMLKALHVRVLLWEFGRAGFARIFMFQEIAAKLARWKWNEARNLQQLLLHTREASGIIDSHELPEHLALLLQHECDEVLDDSIAERAHNLAFNLPAFNAAIGSKDCIESVVEDPVIRSPLDAAAAWFSTLALQRALLESLSARGNSEPSISSNVDLAIKTAPVGSGAQLRGLVARAILSDSSRSADIATSIQVIGPLQQLDESDSKSVPTLMNTSTSLALLPDLRMSLYCAIAIAHLQRSPSPAQPGSAYAIINAIQPKDLSLLGFTAALRLIDTLAIHREAAMACHRALENIAGSLRIWIGGQQGLSSGLKRDTKEIIVDRCLAITKQCIAMEEDAGYGSMTEGVEEE